MKKRGWYKAIHREANNVDLIGQFLKLNLPAIRTIAAKNPPPTAKRAAPMATGWAAAGARACAVPVVPQSIAAHNIKKGDHFTVILLTSLKRYPFLTV
ncbi:hypothetical protein BSG1_11051 [Bacillus sp. SG-1]|nr:hypothetical protein BSG1_11051 [Bacillus sp. SG-1]